MDRNTAGDLTDAQAVIGAGRRSSTLGTTADGSAADDSRSVIGGSMLQGSTTEADRNAVDGPWNDIRSVIGDGMLQAATTGTVTATDRSDIDNVWISVRRGEVLQASTIAATDGSAAGGNRNNMQETVHGEIRQLSLQAATLAAALDQHTAEDFAGETSDLSTLFGTEYRQVSTVQPMLPVIPGFPFFSPEDGLNCVNMYFIAFSGMRSEMIQPIVISDGWTLRLVYKWMKSILSSDFVDMELGCRNIAALRAHEVGVRQLEADSCVPDDVGSFMDYELPIQCAELDPNAAEILFHEACGGCILKISLKGRRHAHCRVTWRSLGSANPRQQREEGEQPQNQRPHLQDAAPSVASRVQEGHPQQRQSVSGLHQQRDHENRSRHSSASRSVSFTDQRDHERDHGRDHEDRRSESRDNRKRSESHRSGKPRSSHDDKTRRSKHSRH